MKLFEASNHNFKILTRRGASTETLKWSGVGLAAKILLWVGVVLIAFDNFDVLTPGSYFGHGNWTTLLTEIIGIAVLFVVIPFLYLESYKNFVKGERIWESEFFWILPSYVFGTFFVYGYDSIITKVILVFSFFVLSFFHIKAYMAGRKFYNKNLSKAESIAYMGFCEYLTLYLLIFFLLSITFNPFKLIISR